MMTERLTPFSSSVHPAGLARRLCLVAALMFAAVLVGGGSSALAQPAADVTPGAYVDHRVDDGAVVVEGEEARLRLTFVRESIVRVDWRRGPVGPDTSVAVVTRARPGQEAPAIHETGDALYVRGPALTAVVQKDPLRVRMVGEDGTPLLEEADPAVAWGDTTRSLHFQLDPSTHFYGTGERPAFGVEGHAFDLENTQRYGYNEAPMTMKVNVPFVATTGGYGLFVDNVHVGRFDVGASDSTRLDYHAGGGTLTYYVLAGESVGEQLRSYTALTGRQPMPPKWALGYIQSKYGYRDQEAAVGVVDTLRRRGFPVDGLVLDLYWFEHMGDLRWDEEAFPEPDAMMADFQERGIHTVTITETYLSRPSRLFQPAIDSSYVGRTPEGDAYVMPDWWSCEGGCDAVLVDMTDPQARDWFAGQYEAFMGEGMDGMWTDLGEPERHPDDMQHHRGPTPEVHNAYNLLWARSLFQHWQDWRPNERPFNLTRSGYAGMQRYAPFLWSGDVGRSFEGLQAQPELMLNMGMSGLAYYSSDLGGFTGENTPPELYARWIQQGALTPMMRPHGVDNQPTEPWRFGQEVEQISRSMVRLRYRLMPYLYSLAWENHRTGMPLVRPLFFADPDNERLHEYTDAVLVGDALLVAPVLEEGKREKTVRLPEGRWVNWHTDAVHEGGQTVTVDAPLDRLPMFVKAGATVPMRPVAPSTSAQPADTLQLKAYPDRGSGAPFTLYEDDGKTLDYQDGAYAVTRLQTTVHARSNGASDVTVEVGAASGAYDGQPERRTLQAAVHRIGSMPARVTVGGEPLTRRTSREAVAERGGWTYDEDRNRVHVQLRGDVHAAHRIRLDDVTLGGG